MQRIKEFIHDRPYVWWGLFLPLYLTLFFTIEQFITDNYWATQLPSDNKMTKEQQEQIIKVIRRCFE